MPVSIAKLHQLPPKLALIHSVTIPQHQRAAAAPNPQTNTSVLLIANFRLTNSYFLIFKL
jgi:hypothetical protein